MQRNVCYPTDKCRSPYRGGCAEHDRECTYTELDVSCGDCISGYSEVDGSCVQGQSVKHESCILMMHMAWNDQSTIIKKWYCTNIKV